MSTEAPESKRKDVKVKENCKDYVAFYQILKETKDRHGAQPTHKLEELLKLKEILKDSIKLDMAYVNDHPAAGILYIICNPLTTLAFYICHKTIHRDFYPNNLLLYTGMSWAKRNGFRYLDLGTTTNKMSPNHNLFMFKEGFGSTGYFRNTYDWRKE